MAPIDRGFNSRPPPLRVGERVALLVFCKVQTSAIRLVPPVLAILVLRLARQLSSSSLLRVTYTKYQHSDHRLAVE
jgi:hypothetical protein